MLDVMRHGLCGLFGLLSRGTVTPGCVIGGSGSPGTPPTFLSHPTSLHFLLLSGSRAGRAGLGVFLALSRGRCGEQKVLSMVGSAGQNQTEGVAPL